MLKLYKLFALFALFAFLSAACEKTQEEENLSSLTHYDYRQQWVGVYEMEVSSTSYTISGPGKSDSYTKIDTVHLVNTLEANGLMIADYSVLVDSLGKIYGPPSGPYNGSTSSISGKFDEEGFRFSKRTSIGRGFVGYTTIDGTRLY